MVTPKAAGEGLFKGRAIPGFDFVRRYWQDSAYFIAPPRRVTCQITELYFWGFSGIQKGGNDLQTVSS